MPFIHNNNDNNMCNMIMPASVPASHPLISSQLHRTARPARQTLSFVDAGGVEVGTVEVALQFDEKDQVLAPSLSLVSSAPFLLSSLSQHLIIITTTIITIIITIFITIITTTTITTIIIIIIVSSYHHFLPSPHPLCTHTTSDDGRLPVPERIYEGQRGYQGPAPPPPPLSR